MVLKTTTSFKFKSYFRVPPRVMFRTPLGHSEKPVLRIVSTIRGKQSKLVPFRRIVGTIFECYTRIGTNYINIVANMRDRNDTLVGCYTPFFGEIGLRNTPFTLFFRKHPTLLFLAAFWLRIQTTRYFSSSPRQYINTASPRRGQLVNIRQERLLQVSPDPSECSDRGSSFRNKLIRKKNFKTIKTHLQMDRF